MIELTHAQIKMIRSLKDKKFRDEYGLFVVEGEKLVREALNSSYEVESVYRMEEIGENVMSRISLCATPSPVLALVRIPADRMRSDRSSCGKCGISGGLCLALDSVRDPGNMGTILRVADWFGVETVYLSPDCTDIFAPKVVQAPFSGYALRLRIFRSFAVRSLRRGVLCMGHCWMVKIFMHQILRGRRWWSWATNRTESAGPYGMK